MLSQTADYALRATLVLARRHGEGPVRVERIAAATGAPRNYLSKTLYALTKAGVVASTRGPAGGFTLAVAPDALTLARVIDCFDGPRVQSRCLLGTGPCDAARPCAAHHRWSAITQSSRASLAATTIADLLAGDAPLPAGPDDATTAAAPSPDVPTDPRAAASAA